MRVCGRWSSQAYQLPSTLRQANSSNVAGLLSVCRTSTCTPSVEIQSTRAAKKRNPSDIVYAEEGTWGRESEDDELR